MILKQIYLSEENIQYVSRTGKYDPNARKKIIKNTSNRIKIIYQKVLSLVTVLCII